jgi:shikimate dehydrogenase
LALFPNDEGMPTIPLEQFTAHFVPPIWFYNTPVFTVSLLGQRGKAKKEGLEMLLQAEASWEIWIRRIIIR